MSEKRFKSRTELGEHGVRLVAAQLSKRGYKPTLVPNHNIGFDIRTTPPGGGGRNSNPDSLPPGFEIEVKRSTSKGTQVPMQIKSHLECPPKHRFYVIVKDSETGDPDFFVMSHKELQKAWAAMPRIKPNGEPYVIGGTGYIDWKHISLHQNRWDKLPS